MTATICTGPQTGEPGTRRSRRCRRSRRARGTNSITSTPSTPNLDPSLRTWASPAERAHGLCNYPSIESQLIKPPDSVRTESYPDREISPAKFPSSPIPSRVDAGVKELPSHHATLSFCPTRTNSPAACYWIASAVMRTPPLSTICLRCCQPSLTGPSTAAFLITTCPRGHG